MIKKILFGLGYIFSYLLFSCMLSFILLFTKKITFGIEIVFVFAFVFILTIIGISLNRWLK